jgi:hypothetical protein
MILNGKIQFFQTKVKRLYPPYYSNCFEYKNSESFKSCGHCINDCFINKITKNYNCIPEESAKIYDDINPEFNILL